ncbi:hypothetical protein Q9290_14790 [Oceanimonas sp. CHS3-5]|uniref:hypothetical protein n=1 Tax=Oceanimonas sp. CHS3-5 TaxID=3068186 RepID=UPI00273DDDCB|nr:hypothetical protein [Oceanimonas sp. CHS3-5]MDP5293549.1 hypothetical protein [Oceanimonas sp. CHS3-5]
MIYEYAIEPELLMHWASNDRDYREFLREYGLGTPRLTSSFPKQKAAKFRSYYLRKGPRDEQSNEAQRYLEMVNYIAESLVYRNNIECDGSCWESNILHEDSVNPFYAILTSTPIDSKRCLTPNTMYSEGSIWNHECQISVSRTYENLFPILSNMFSLAQEEIIIVDGYGWNQRAIEFIAKLLNGVLCGKGFNQCPELVLFYKDKKDDKAPDAAYVKSEIEKRAPGIKDAVKFQVISLSEVGGGDVFHNRCILTEHGGIAFGHGIDVTENSFHSDEVTLMNKAVYIKKWDQFVDDLCFEVVSQA